MLDIQRLLTPMPKGEGIGIGNRTGWSIESPALCIVERDSVRI